MQHRIWLSSTLTAVTAIGCTAREASRAPDTSTPAAAATVTLAGTPASATVQQAVDSSVARYNAAVEAGDASAVADMYTDDAMVLAPDDDARRGHDQIRQAYGGFLSSARVVSVSHHRLDLTAVGDYAIESGAYGLTIQPKGAAVVHDSGTYVMIWKKQSNGSYKLFRDIFNSDQRKH